MREENNEGEWIKVSLRLLPYGSIIQPHLQSQLGSGVALNKHPLP